jgi:hypothetical protein
VILPIEAVEINPENSDFCVGNFLTASFLATICKTQSDISTAGRNLKNLSGLAAFRDDKLGEVVADVRDDKLGEVVAAV